MTPPGFYTGSVTPSSVAASVTVDLKACYAGPTNFALALGSALDEICHTEHIVRGTVPPSNGPDLTGTWCGTLTSIDDPNPDSDPGKVILTLTQNQNAISGTIEFVGNGSGVPLSATLSGTQLLNVSVGTAPHINTGTGTVTGNTITIRIGDTQLRTEIVVTRGVPGCP